MSHAVDEAYDVYHELGVIARKHHECGACKETIRVGNRYWRIFLRFDGDTTFLKRCARCQEIHLHLRDLGEEMWPDERLDCGEEYEHHWGEPPPEHIARLAFLLPGEDPELPLGAPK